MHFVISREAQKRKRKALQILIEDISREDNSTLVKCQLNTSKATVTFTFNCDVDTPEDISENLVCHVGNVVCSTMPIALLCTVIFVLP